MGEIALLPEDVRNRIAAGEVIERPASVVKELVENALDAGATRLRIDLADGGVRRIRVVDDGSGIAWEDLVLAVASHATSKLRRAEDLFAIRTLGFRGEALASIGSVSRLEIASRRRGAPAGGRIRLEGGRLFGPEPHGTPEGTVVEVRDLFFNVPARRKFLRSHAAELAAVTEWLHRIAVAVPSAALSVTHDGRSVLDLPAQDERARLSELFGRTLSDALVRVDAAFDGLTLRGWVAKPSVNRPDRRWELLSVNGRPVRDRLLWAAVSAAMETFVPHGRHPAVFLDLRIDPSVVDVNVHPAKYEVRFRDAAAVRGALVRAIRDALAGETPIPAPPTTPASETQAPFGDPPVPPEEAADAATRPSFDSGATRVRMDGEAFLPGFAHPFSGRAIQIHDSYLVTEHPEGIEIVDQHALHERILYDRFREAARAARVPSQALAIPETIEFDRSEMEFLRVLEPVLSAVGITTRGEGASAVAVCEAPPALSGARLRRFFERLLEETARDGTPPAPELLRERVVRIAACQSAVKFGDRLSSEEIQALLAERKEGVFHLSCQHGRPTSWVIPTAELERKFERR
ncbi:MAG: DNA mismatch repair endonuclease MutL [Planctomycetes bacterium]|nr:DNA mismatch repair endonuclease MutL [Planctomycetota bacterium]